MFDLACAKWSWIYFFVYLTLYAVCKKSIYRSSHQRCSIKKAVLKMFILFTKKNLCWGLFSEKLQSISTITLLKRDSTLVFCCEYCKIFRNTSFEEHLGTTFSVFRKAYIIHSINLAGEVYIMQVDYETTLGTIVLKT